MPKPGESLLSALEKIPIQLLPESRRYLCRAGDKAAPKRHTEARHKVRAQALTEAGGSGGKPGLALWELRVSPGSAEPGSCPSPCSAPAPASTSAPPWKSRHRHPQAARGPGRADPRQGEPQVVLPRASHPAIPPWCPPSSQPPLSPGAWSQWQLQQDRAPFPLQCAGQGCPNGAQMVLSCGQQPAETREGNDRGPGTDRSSSSGKTLQSCSTSQATPGQAPCVGGSVLSVGQAQPQLAKEPSSRARLAGSAQHRAKSAVGAAGEYRTHDSGLGPLRGCPCHQGKCCQRCRGSQGTPQPLAGSLSICPPIPTPTGGLLPEWGRTRSCSDRGVGSRSWFPPLSPAAGGAALRVGLGWAGLG